MSKLPNQTGESIRHDNIDYNECDQQKKTFFNTPTKSIKIITEVKNGEI